jgi:hypothetical protein
MRSKIRALIVATRNLESEVTELMKAVSHAYARGRFHSVSRYERSIIEATYYVALPLIATLSHVGPPTQERLNKRGINLSKSLPGFTSKGRRISSRVRRSSICIPRNRLNATEFYRHVES